MEGALDELQDETGTKRIKVTTSCDACRRRKVKCSAGQPRCSNCEIAKIECIYSGMGTKRGPPKGYVAVIEDRLHTIENLLSELVLQNKDKDNAIGSIKTEGRSISSILSMRGQTPSDSVGSPRLMTSPVSRSMPSPVWHTGKHGPHDIDALEAVEASWEALVEHSSRNNLFFDDPAPVTDSEPPIITGLTVFPSSELADHLIDLYFTHYHPHFPVLHKRTFFEQIRNPAHPPSALLMLAVFATSARYSSHPVLLESGQNQDQLGMPFFEQAAALLDRFIDTPRLTTIQALLLLSTYEYGYGHASRPWVYQGIAVRMAQSLGLHRKFNGPNRTEAEVRKRIFWSIFVLDRLCSTVQGLPLGISDKDYDVDLPSLDAGDVGDELISIINYRECIRLIQIFGTVLSHVYAPSKTLPVTRDYTALFSVFEAELNTWTQSLPTHLKFSSPPQSSINPAIPSSPFACHLHMLYYLLLILIHRPVLQRPDRSALIATASSLHICTNAANRIVSLADAMLSQSPENCITFPFSSYFINVASSIHCMNLSSKDSRLSVPARAHLMTTIRLHKLFLHTGMAEHAATRSARDLERLLSSISDSNSQMSSPESSPAIMLPVTSGSNQPMKPPMMAQGVRALASRFETAAAKDEERPIKPVKPPRNIHNGASSLLQSQPQPAAQQPHVEMQQKSFPTTLSTPPAYTENTNGILTTDETMTEGDPFWHGLDIDWASLDSTQMPPPAWVSPGYNPYAQTSAQQWPQPPPMDAKWEEGINVGALLNQSHLPMSSFSGGRRTQQNFHYPNSTTTTTQALNPSTSTPMSYSRFGNNVTPRPSNSTNAVSFAAQAGQTIVGATNTIRFVVGKKLKRSDSTDLTSANLMGTGMLKFDSKK